MPCEQDAEQEFTPIVKISESYVAHTAPLQEKNDDMNASDSKKYQICGPDSTSWNRLHPSVKAEHSAEDLSDYSSAFLLTILLRRFLDASIIFWQMMMFDDLYNTLRCPGGLDGGLQDCVNCNLPSGISSKITAPTVEHTHQLLDPRSMEESKTSTSAGDTYIHTSSSKDYTFGEDQCNTEVVPLGLNQAPTKPREGQKRITLQVNVQGD